MLNNQTLFLSFVISILIAGCQGTGVLTPEPSSATPRFSLSATLTPVPPAPTATVFASKEATPTEFVTTGPTTSPEARLKVKCLTIVPTPSNVLMSDGVIVLESRVIVNGRYKPETYLLDMRTGKAVTVKNGGGFSISPDRTLMAYENTIFDDQDKIVKDELVIADANGQSLKVIPWENDWLSLLGWAGNQHLVISRPGLYKVTLAKPDTLEILNPFTDERRLLQPDFPKIVDNLPETQALPSWDGWFDVLYDPTLTRAIYPRFIGNKDEQLTYALWDVSSQKLVTSLEKVFAVPSSDNGIYPMPRWSPDGSQFVFRGLVHVSDKLARFELYRVSRKGEVAQLTQLTSIALAQDSNLSWSADGQYIAMYLNKQGEFEQQARLAVLDMTSLDITDYCLPVSYSSGVVPPMPIWSPDGKQILVFDSSDPKHSRVILVDIAQGFATQISQDAEPVGWMSR